MADVCALYLNKYLCITKNYHKYNEIKTTHCLAIYEKISSLIINNMALEDCTFTDIDNFFT